MPTISPPRTPTAEDKCIFTVRARCIRSCSVQDYAELRRI